MSQILKPNILKNRTRVMKGKCIARHSKMGYPTEGLHGYGVPHKGFAWFWGTPQRVCMVLGYPTEGLHKSLVFAVFWGGGAKAQTANPTVTKAPPSGS